MSACAEGLFDCFSGRYEYLAKAYIFLIALRALLTGCQGFMSIEQ